MRKTTSILLLAMYLSTLFAHSTVSAVHDILHYTSEVVAIHAHGHSHDVADHGDIFKAEDPNHKSKTAHVNMLSLVFYYHSPADILSDPEITHTELLSKYIRIYQSRVNLPSVPPPIG